MSRFIPVAVIGLVLVFSIFYFTKHRTGDRSEVTKTPEASASATPNSAVRIAQPITNAVSRITKKPFGIYITPQSSPVQPERFTGYHTGTDFETTPVEQNAAVNVYAICDGPLVLKETASGYGGVAVQRCTLGGQAVTVIYGHIKLASVAATVGQELTPGEQFAVLGVGYSTETDGERKHLHLGIHIGTVINITGYVANKSQLSGWLNPATFLQ